MPTLIGLDLGTTTVSGTLLDAARGQVLRLAQRPNDAAVPSPLPTRAEQDPNRLHTLALEVLAELAAGGGPVGDGQPAHGIALTGQMHGLLCAGADGEVLTPLISWQDRRTAEPLKVGGTTLERIYSHLAGLPWQENGCRLNHGYGAATLFWLAQHGGLPPATQRVCTIADWLGGRLTGRPPVTDPTLAASWGVYNVVENEWNAAFLDRLGLEAGLFPPVRSSGEPVGGLLPPIARQVGLAAGIPVFNALGDTQASFLGASPPLPGGSKRDVLVEPAVLFNLGTGGQICWAVPAFEPPAEAVETHPLPPGRYLRVGASLCGGAAYAWLNRTVRAWLAEFGIEMDEETVYQRLNALARACEGSAGLRVQTTFLGVRGDPTVQAGSIAGITPENMQLGVLARATLEGIVDELYGLYHAHTGCAHAGETARHSHLVATGGGVRRNPLLPALLEEKFALPVQVPPQRETAAVGAAMWAFHAVTA